MIKEVKIDDQIFKVLIELYKAVGWHAYTDEPVELRLALDNSTYLYGYYQDEILLGFIRGLTDYSALNYVQDIIVNPEFHNKGIGSELLKYVKNKYDVRCQILLTDDEPGQLAYYAKNGYKNGTYVKLWDGIEDNIVAFKIMDKNPYITPADLYNELEIKYSTLS